MVAARQSVSRVLAQTQASLYVCRSCRHQLSRTGISVQQQRFASRHDLPTTEKARRKQPVVDSSSGGSTFVEKKRGRRQAEREVAGRTAQEDVITQQSSVSGRTQRLLTRSSPEDYSPAESWEGLQYIGSTGSWRDMPPQPDDAFSAWLHPSSGPAANREQLVSCLHQALVECLTCNQAGLDPNSTVYFDLAETDENIVDAFASAKIAVSENGVAEQVRFATEAQAQDLVEMLAAVGDTPLSDNLADTTPDIEADAQSMSELAVHEIEADAIQPQDEPVQSTQSNALHYAVQDESFLSAQLNADNPITFSVLKRFSQLSGHRIPDPVISTLFSANKPFSFLIEQVHDLVVKPEPKKVADVLMNKPGLNSLSNVMIFPRRATPVDKEKELGRWKVIERELRDRGLPTLGRLKL